MTVWALLPLSCCAAASGDWRPGLRAATAVELYITAGDLFDDVEDGDASAIIDRYGSSIVVNLATALLALSLTTLRPYTNDASDAFACSLARESLLDGLLVSTGGQHLDLASAGAPPLKVEDCLDIAKRKGGALGEACGRAGAVFGTKNPALIELLGLFGRSFGVFGQLDNDMHDAGSDRHKSDLARRKQTVPIAVARAGGEPAAIADEVWRGGVQLAYALVYAERARAEEALEAAAIDCPDPEYARSVLGALLHSRGIKPVVMDL